MGFAIPDYRNIKFALTVQLGDPMTSEWNLVIFFTCSFNVNWDIVRQLIKNPNKKVLSIELSSSAWSYKCCDYSVGTMLGLVEVATGKKFSKIPKPEIVKDVGVECYELT